MKRPALAFLNFAIAIVVAAGVIVGAASLWFRDAVYGDRSIPAVPVTVVVPRGATFSEVTASLQHAGVLAHPLAFRILARLRGDESEIKSGEYRFPAPPNQRRYLATARQRYRGRALGDVSGRFHVA